jgi:hypothetical protein
MQNTDTHADSNKKTLIGYKRLFTDARGTLDKSLNYADQTRSSLSKRLVFFLVFRRRGRGRGLEG